MTTKYTFETNGRVRISGKSFDDTFAIAENNNYSGKLYIINKSPSLKIGENTIKGKTSKKIVFTFRRGEIL